MKKLVLLVLFVLICMPVGTALAFTMTEVADLANTNMSTTDLGNFDIGLNTISGSVARDQDNGGDYGDFWDASLLSGMQITGIEFELSIDRTGDAGSLHAMVADGFIYNGTSTIMAHQWLSTDGIYSLSGAYPFGAGQYYFGAAASFNSIYTYNYEWRITVASVDSGTSPVPEPATMLLFGIGLLGLAGVNRRKK